MAALTSKLGSTKVFAANAKRQGQQRQEKLRNQLEQNKQTLESRDKQIAAQLDGLAASSALRRSEKNSAEAELRKARAAEQRMFRARNESERARQRDLATYKASLSQQEDSEMAMTTEVSLGGGGDPPRRPDSPRPMGPQGGGGSFQLVPALVSSPRMAGPWPPASPSISPAGSRSPSPTWFGSQRYGQYRPTQDYGSDPYNVPLKPSRLASYGSFTKERIPEPSGEPSKPSVQAAGGALILGAVALLALFAR